MKSFQRIILAFTVVASLFAGELDQADRNTLLSHLTQSASELRDSVKGLTSEQWNYKPAADVWSVAECAEHIVLSEDLIRNMIESKILATPASPERIAERKLSDEKVLKMITDRSVKAKAPEVLKPGRQFATPEAALEKFQEARSKTIALAKSRSDLREHAAPHSVLKELDAYQWLLYLSGHTMRHTAQIREVKTTTGFPSSK